MTPPGSRRLVVLVIVTALLAIAAGVWYHRLAGGQTPEERMREKAEELRRRVGDLTHGK